MSITDELREQLLYYTPAADAGLIAIADRIDEKHERTKRNLTDALRKQEAATRELSEKSVLLPRDADGEPIHLGDRLVESEFVPNGGKVVGIKLYMGWDHWLVNCGAWVDPRKCRHVKNMTVEDVLRDVVTLCHNIWKEGSISGHYDVDDVMNSGNIAEYAKRIAEVIE